MAEIILCCGKVCSGKSTFSKILEKQEHYFHFSADDWMLHFYDETENRQLFNLELDKCIKMIHIISKKLLNSGNNVIHDFGYWTQEDRTETRKMYEDLGHKVTLLYFPIKYTKQIEYMNLRQENKALKHYKFNENTIKELNKFFEQPKKEEKFVLVNNYHLLTNSQIL